MTAGGERAGDEACEPCGDTGIVECWNPGGPCPVPNDPACDTCGPCNSCDPAADRVAALTAVNDGLREDAPAVLLREAVARALTAPLPDWTGGSDVDYWTRRADAVLALPEVRALVEKVRRVEALAATHEAEADRLAALTTLTKWERATRDELVLDRRLHAQDIRAALDGGA